MAKKKVAKKPAKKKTTKKKTAKKAPVKKKKKAAAVKKGLPTRKEIIKRHKKFKKEIGSKLFPNAKLKAYYSQLGIRVDSSLIDGVTDEIYVLLKKAAMRTVKNGRKTVRPWDF